MGMTGALVCWGGSMDPIIIKGTFSLYGMSVNMSAIGEEVKTIKSGVKALMSSNSRLSFRIFMMIRMTSCAACTSPSPLKVACKRRSMDGVAK